MIIVYNLTDTVIRAHKRFSIISISAAIIKFIFKNSLIKNLFILIVINNYNYYINKINIIN